jgi:hypothetical protein
MDAQSKAAKKYDLEESPRDVARRLIAHDVDRLSERYTVLRKRLLRHSVNLTPEDTRDLISYLERQFESTRTLLEGVSEPVEFGFGSALRDHLDF